MVNFVRLKYLSGDDRFESRSGQFESDSFSGRIGSALISAKVIFFCYSFYHLSPSCPNLPCSSFWYRPHFPDPLYMLSFNLLIRQNHLIWFCSVNVKTDSTSNSSLVSWFLMLFFLVTPITLVKNFVSTAWVYSFIHLTPSNANDSEPKVNSNSSL